MRAAGAAGPPLDHTAADAEAAAARSGSDAGLPQGAAKVTAVRAMFDAIAPRYDLVNRVMTFGLDRGWRRATVRALTLGDGELVVDLACGTGDLCRDLAAAGYRPVGVDLSFGMLAHASVACPLVQGDALRLPFPDGCLDGATSGFALRNFVELDGFFAELARVLRPGGRIALLDVARPENALLRLGHGVYFGRVVPRIGAVLSDGAAYRYLPRSVAYLPPIGVMLDRLRASGFEAVERRLLSGGITQMLTATRRSGR
jgi:demethylmenaquinone methyltransferase/2-methoxy-6-polyprenyl-1,4-benzoquinol methylase